MNEINGIKYGDIEEYKKINGSFVTENNSDFDNVPYDSKIPNVKFWFSIGALVGPYPTDLKNAIKRIIKMAEKLPETEIGYDKPADWASTKEIILYSLNDILNNIKEK